MLPPIPDCLPCTSASDFERELRAIREILELTETEDSWEKIGRGLLRLAAITRGGAATFVSQYVAGIKSVSRPITSALLSERTRLSGYTVELITVVIEHLAQKFEPLLLVFVPSILKLCSRTNKIYISRGQELLFQIISCTNLVALLSYLRECTKDKNQGLRIVAAETAFRCINECDTVHLESKVADIEYILKNAGRDQNPEVRQSAKKIFNAYSILFPHRLADFIAPLTPVTRRYLDIKNSTSSASMLPPKQVKRQQSRPAIATSDAAHKPAPSKSEFSSSSRPPLSIFSASTSGAHIRGRAQADGHIRPAKVQVDQDALAASASRSESRTRVERERPRALRPERVEPTTDQEVGGLAAAIPAKNFGETSHRRAQRPVRPQPDKTLSSEVQAEAAHPEAQSAQLFRPVSSQAFYRQRTTSVSSVNSSTGSRPASVLSNARTAAAITRRVAPAPVRPPPTTTNTLAKSRATPARPDQAVLARSNTRSVSPAKARSVSPTKARSVSPTKARSVSPTKARSVSPTKARVASPVKTRAASPTKPSSTNLAGSTKVRPPSRIGTTMASSYNRARAESVNSRPVSAPATRTRVESNASTKSVPGTVTSTAESRNISSRPPVTSSGSRPPVTKRYIPANAEPGFVPKRTLKTSLTQPTLSALARTKATMEEKAATAALGSKPTWGTRSKPQPTDSKAIPSKDAKADERKVWGEKATVRKAEPAVKAAAAVPLPPSPTQSVRPSPQATPVATKPAPMPEALAHEDVPQSVEVAEVNVHVPSPTTMDVYATAIIHNTIASFPANPPPIALDAVDIIPYRSFSEDMDISEGPMTGMEFIPSPAKEITSPRRNNVLVERINQ